MENGGSRTIQRCRVLAARRLISGLMKSLIRNGTNGGGSGSHCDSKLRDTLYGRYNSDYRGGSY